MQAVILFKNYLYIIATFLKLQKIKTFFWLIKSSIQRKTVDTLSCVSNRLAPLRLLCTQLTDRVLEEFKQVRTCFNREIFQLDEQSKVSRVPLEIRHFPLCMEAGSSIFSNSNYPCLRLINNCLPQKSELQMKCN